MNHTPENKHRLEKMTSQEKYNRTNYESMKLRKQEILTLKLLGKITVLAVFDSEMPYEGTKEHRILWCYGGEPNKEYKKIIDGVLSMYVSMGYEKPFQNPPQDCSVPQRPHRHIIKR